MSIASTGQTAEEKGVARAAYSAAETAVKLGVSEASVWRAIRCGRIKAIKFGGRTLIAAQCVDGLFDTAA